MTSDFIKQFQAMSLVLSPPLIGGVLAVNVTRPLLCVTIIDPNNAPPYTYQWTLGSGSPPGASFETPTAQCTYFGPLALNTRYSVTLTVTNAAGDSEELSFTAVSTNDLPDVYAGPDTTLDDVPDTYTMEATASDPLGRSLTYLWEVVSYPGTLPGISSPTALNPTITFNHIFGVYVFRLTVSNGLYAASSQVTLTVSNPPDVFTQVSPYVGSVAGSASDAGGIFYKMLGIFNVVTPGSTPIFTTSDGINAALVAPDGTAQSLGTPLTQVGIYYMYGYVPLNVMYSGSVGETRHYNIQFNAQNETFTVTRPGIRFAASIPTYNVSTSSGSQTLTARGFSSFSDYSIAIDLSPQSYTHFGADNAIWTPAFSGGLVGGTLSWSGYISDDGTTYYAQPHGSITNLDPYPLPPAGAIFGSGTIAPVRTATYETSGMCAAGLDYYMYFVQTY